MSTIGETLRERRIRAKIDINEVEEATKIRAKYLRSLENEEFDLLPGRAYAASFLRTYGDFLGLDGRRLVERYKEEHEPSEPAQLSGFSPDPGLTRARESRRRHPIVLAALALLVVLAVLALVGRSNDGGGQGSNGSAVVVPAGGSSGRSNGEPRGTGTERQRATAGPPFSIKIALTEPAWLCVTDGDGKQLVPGKVIGANEELSPAPSRSGFRMRFSGGGAMVRWKGGAYRVPAGPQARGLTVDRDSGARPLALDKAPTCG